MDVMLFWILALGLFALVSFLFAPAGPGRNGSDRRPSSWAPLTV